MKRVLAVLLIGVATAIAGCKDLTGSQGLPSGTPDPVFYNNKTGALGMRNAAIFEFEQALPSYIIDSGLLTDELEDYRTNASQGVLLQNGTGVSDPLDERIAPVGVTVPSYSKLQAVRTFANQAIGALAAFDTGATALDSSKVLRGELYAVEGFAETMLADLFCSGVPLSTLDFQKDYTYAASSTKARVYQDAIAKFDTALALATTNDSVMNLARIGLGRVNLNLGKYVEAADDVVVVPDGFRYQFELGWGSIANGGGTGNILNEVATVSDREGLNGLPFRSSSDARTAVDSVVVTSPGSATNQDTLTFPAKYNAALSGPGYAPFVLASGVEARLIKAESQLQSASQGSWLETLNILRRSIGLSDTTDPGTPQGRIALLFRERAFWLFLDGHRQGDLRRLLAQYGRQYPSSFGTSQQVYPTGHYFAPGTGVYGTAVVAPIPAAEDANPEFHGCLSYDP